MHIHNWKWHENEKRWTCTCGEIVTLKEFTQEYGRLGNLDVDPIPALNRLASKRKGDAHIPDFR